MEVPAEYSLQKQNYPNGVINEVAQQLQQQLCRSSEERSCQDDEGEEEEDEEAMLYTAKYHYLLDYYQHIFEMNNRLRHRIYHVKKEVNHLKQLKRLLCERLLFRRVEIIDTNLEIPDNDSGVNSAMELVGEIANAAASNPSQPSVAGANTTSGVLGGSAGGAGRKRKRAGTGGNEEGLQQQMTTATLTNAGGGEGSAKNSVPSHCVQQHVTPRAKLSRGGGDEAKRNIISIIESIVADTHRANKQKMEAKSSPSASSAGCLRRRQPPPSSAAVVVPASSSSSLPSSSSSTFCHHHPQQQTTAGIACNCCGVSSSNNSNYEPLSESDLSAEELAERLIHRRSSIDHLLPEAPEPDEDADGVEEEEKGRDRAGRDQRKLQQKDVAIFEEVISEQRKEEEERREEDSADNGQAQQQQQTTATEGTGVECGESENGRQKQQLQDTDAANFLAQATSGGDPSEEKDPPTNQLLKQQQQQLTPTTTASAFSLSTLTPVGPTTSSMPSAENIGEDGGDKHKELTEKRKSSDDQNKAFVEAENDEDDEEMEQEL